MSNSTSTRRDFLKTTLGAASAAAAVPYFYSSTKTLAQETRSKNDRFRIGLIGAGGMGRGNMHAAKPYCDVVAICDVDANRVEEANHELSGGKADTCKDYREILERNDLDALHIATPDHWHTKPLVEAMLAGFDVYCEKPMTMTIDEGKLIRKVQKETGRIVQVGTQQRSTFNLFTKAIAIIQSERLGKIKRVEACIGGAPSCNPIPIVDVPKGLDWDRWLGPAPKTDYRMIDRGGTFPDTNCHFNFRWWYEYSGGKLTDWGAHHVDICTWALEANGQDAIPLSIRGPVEHPVPFKNGNPTVHDRYNTATKFRFTVDLPGGVEMVIRSDGRNGALIEGEKGRIFVNRGCLQGAPVEALADDPLPEGAVQKAYKGAPMESWERAGHWANFFRCVRDRKEPISDVHSHMKALNTCHLAGICARLGRTLKWDGKNEQIVGDDQANAMLARPYRDGYAIEM